VKIYQKLLNEEYIMELNYWMERIVFDGILRFSAKKFDKIPGFVYN
jgi:hypothetical protein